MPELKARGNHGLTLVGNNLFSEPRRDSYLFVDNADKLPEAVDGEHLLPADTLVEISGTVDLGANALRLSTGTTIRGMHVSNDVVQSSADGVIRCSGLESNVLLREFNIVATGGRCINLSGHSDYQLNIFYVGFIGASAGTVSGFDVQAIKSCFVKSADGFTFAGATSKLFVDGTPFFNITGAAITLDETLVCKVADIRVSFFKFDSPGVGIKAEAGYSVTAGVYTSNLIDGTAVPLEGLSPSDAQWKMIANTGVRDSRVTGTHTLDAPSETVIETINTPVKIAGETTQSTLTERLGGAEVDNRLQYEGTEPALVTAQLAVNLQGGNNVDGAIMIAKNGSVVEESRLDFRLSTGADERAATTFVIVEMVKDDYIEAWIENQSGTGNFTVNTMTLVGRA